MPVVAQGFIEIDNECLVGGIGDRSHTKERNAAGGSGFGHTGRFHFHGRGASGSDSGFLFGGLGYSIYRGEDSGCMRFGGA
ncbi:MAG TPA: hypothetical protein VMR62_11605 [Bryobacteraceae bacterium]|nr:hypothetical protein [Bryobacteraceae bacterium]